MNTTTGPAQRLVLLAPEELATELGIPIQDAPTLAKAPVQIPSSWIESWRTKTGPRELTPGDVMLLTGMTRYMVYKALQNNSDPCLRSRTLNTGRPRHPLIAPADLVNYLRAVNAANGINPTLAETPTQSRLRGERDRLEALAACDGN